MSEKSILNLLSSVAILTGHTDQNENAVCSAMQVSSDKEQNQCFVFFLLRLLDEEIRFVDSRSAVVVDAVDLPADEDADPAVAPLAPVGQQEGNQQSQTCRHKHTLY